ncbi:polymer-forming cytoskeletal protein [Hydrogenophaga sp. 5NK40-0174]|uniref:bactofilin family protein n=1 Tax=Hydrogenophaga sp. 5NK40-0174 TaxID=3127649 RepID=UPI0031035DC5
MSQKPTSTRLVPAERLSAITSLIAEGAVFDGNFHTSRDQGIKVDGQLKGNITFETGGTLHIGPTGVIENTCLEADYVFIEGKVIGQVIARKALEITGTATLIGDASYDELIDMHPRARVRGKIDYRGDIDSEPLPAPAAASGGSGDNNGDFSNNAY